MGRPTKPAHERALIEARRKTVSANLLAGFTLEEIAGALDCPLSTVRRDVKVLLDEMREARIEMIASHADIDLARLDRIIVANWPRMMQGDPNAARIVMEAIDRRARILGTYAPEKLAVAGMSYEELLEKAKAILSAHSG